MSEEFNSTILIPILVLVGIGLGYYAVKYNWRIKNWF